MKKKFVDVLIFVVGLVIISIVGYVAFRLLSFIFRGIGENAGGIALLIVVIGGGILIYKFINK